MTAAGPVGKQGKTPVFVSFDYDHDLALKNLFVGQAKHERTPFSIVDWSIKKESSDWRDRARSRIRRAEQVIVICGLHTHRAAGVAEEIKIARSEGTPYFLLRGRATGRVRKPQGTLLQTVQPWTWPNVERLLAGQRHWFFG